MGGRIDKVDLVRDSMDLQIPGSHTIKILFDERTQVFENGTHMSVLDLKPTDHASVETRLDGSAIFAMRIHILTDVPEGKFRGQVTDFNAASGELKLRVADGKDLVTLTVPAGTPMERQGQNTTTKQAATAADLMRGALIDISFKSNKSGHGVATRVDVLAVPGSEFLFRGNLSALDMRAGRMSVASATEMTPRDVVFDAARFPVTKDLRVGMPVQVKSRFDGTHYVATEISAE